jgi:hypothetical protein
LNKIIAKKVPYLKPSSLVIVAIKIFIYGIKLIGRKKFFKAGLNNFISLDKLFALDEILLKM